MAMSEEAHMGCCLFLRRPSLISRHAGYRHLTAEDGYGSPSEDEPTAIRVVVGKEKRVFLVDPFILTKHPFRVLLEMAGKGKIIEEIFGAKDAIFVDVDAILFEHILWLVCNDCSSSSSFSKSASCLLELNLKEIIEFYSQDYWNKNVLIISKLFIWEVTTFSVFCQFAL